MGNLRGLLACLFVSTLLLPAWAVAQDTVRIGVLAFNGKQQALERWNATADYLGKQVSGAEFVIVPLGLREFEHAVNKRELDFFLTNSGHYVKLEVDSGATRLATFRSREKGQVLTHFSAVLFSRAGQGVQTLRDLQGKSFAAVSPDAFGGFQLAQLAFREAGMDVYANLTLKWLGFPHADIVHAVVEGRADAGIVRAGVLEKLSEAGLIRMEDVQVLAPRTHPGFPFVHSTGLYPEWPFARLPHVDTELARKVSLALLGMSMSHPAAVAAGGAGWTIPLDYTSVHQVFRQLALPPYQPQPLTLKALFSRYGHWFLLGLGLLLISSTLLLRLFRVNRRMLQAKTELIEQQELLEQTVDARTNELLDANRSLQQDIACRLETEQSLHNACDTLQSFYSLAIRADLGHQQKLISMLDLCRQFLAMERAQVISRDDAGALLVELCIPETGQGAPFNLDAVKESITSAQTLMHRAENGQGSHVVCPVQLAQQSACVFEFTSSGHSSGVVVAAEMEGDAEIQLRILHLVAYWMANERALAQAEIEEQTVKRRFSTVSPREAEVLALLIQGEPSKLIARALDISLKTVELHRANLLKKTGAKTSLELVSMAVRAGYRA